ncbi:hypothetical protein EJ110_NYTH47423 [Nymphaea thermarum]|nr:hypothetical protein EJ110_NYTH47423 [Nymphaea thermarum]
MKSQLCASMYITVQVFMEAKFCILYSLQSSIGSLQKGSCDKRWDRSSPWKGRSDGRESLALASRQMPR